MLPWRGGAKDLRVAPTSTGVNIGCYVLGSRLNSNRTFEVWQSQHRDLAVNARPLVVKRLLPELSDNPRLVEQAAQRAVRAKRLLHPGFVAVLDVVVERETCCIVTERLEGYCLSEVLEHLRRCQNALPVWFALEVGEKLASALEYAHH